MQNKLGINSVKYIISLMAGLKKLSYNNKYLSI